MIGQDDIDDETLARYEVVKNTLNDIANSKAKGAILRSKVRWNEEGEKSTKYFANLEKRNFDTKHISELITKENGQSISDPKEILKQGADYYHNLYSSNKAVPENTELNSFFNLPKNKKLT